jgi:EAL domain-containing protein (putative c-di-GMP-specific phosphodiesterase class I)
LREIRQACPDQPVTLEIHESAAVHPETMKELRAILDSLDMQLAYDDFGAGQARLVELVRVSPDVLKFDMALVQNIHRATPQHQQMLGALVQISKDLGIVPLAEGVECAEDSQVCRQLGFELGQGYFYGRPATASSFRSKL